MATLDATTLAKLRQRVSRKAAEKGVSEHWLKGQINDALQAVEDRLQAAGTITAIRGDIETAAPGVFTNAEKDFLYRYLLSDLGDRLEATL